MTGHSRRLSLDRPEESVTKPGTVFLRTCDLHRIPGQEVASCSYADGTTENGVPIYPLGYCFAERTSSLLFPSNTEQLQASNDTNPHTREAVARAQSFL